MIQYYPREWEVHGADLIKLVEFSAENIQLLRRGSFAYFPKKGHQ